MALRTANLALRPTVAVLPPGEFNSMIPWPLSVYYGSSRRQLQA